MGFNSSELAASQNGQMIMTTENLTSLITGFHSCPPNWWGIYCDNACSCYRNSTCITGITGFGCDCLKDTWGPDCSGVCNCNLGVCSDGENGNGTCSCYPNAYGPTCEACQCINGLCNATAAGDGTCTCYERTFGPLCETCTCNPLATCNTGLTGTGKCESCPKDLWGPDCYNECTCENGDCVDGPTGTGLCSRCYQNFYGPNCNMTCSCGNDTSIRCNDDVDGDGTCSELVIPNNIEQQFPMQAVVGGSVGGALAFIALLILAICIWRKRNSGLDISSLHEEIRWYFDENRISKEAGWNHAFGDGFLVKEVTEEKKYINRLKGLLNNHLDGSKITFDKVYAIYNKTLISNFIGSRRVIGVRHTNSETIFKKQDWKNVADGKLELREWYKETYDKLAAGFTWNSPSDKVPIIPVVHGTDGKIGQQICSAGFAALSSLDAGYYGKGIYFTSSCLYATPYFATKAEPAILVCLTIPGNVRPIVEHRSGTPNFLGVPIDSGYQSHYVLTTRDGNPLTKKKDRYYDEFVLASDPQVVPIFLIYVNQSVIFQLAKDFAREIPGDEKPIRESNKRTNNKSSRKVKVPEPINESLKESLLDNTPSEQEDTRQIAVD